ncbi:MAG: TIGR04283 family arsenosugar biosynthesis glycosyltransferase [Aquaticitalea sp.]
MIKTFQAYSVLKVSCFFMNKISIIIPILNESETIGRLLQHLFDNSSSNNISEIIVVDGGSTDNSKTLVGTFPSVILMNSTKGRAKQMNFGAKNAKGNILFFLHADSFPPKYFDQLIIDEVDKGNEAGCFRMKFDSNHWWLCSASWFTRFNWRACRGGDQSQFITKKLFDAIGGYDERFVIYEDNILIQELYNRNQFVVISKTLKTSARLYKKHGVWKLQYHFGMIYFKKWKGADADELYAYYKKYIC